MDFTPAFFLLRSYSKVRKKAVVANVRIPSWAAVNLTTPRCSSILMYRDALLVCRPNSRDSRFVSCRFVAAFYSKSLSAGHPVIIGFGSSAK